MTNRNRIALLSFVVGLGVIVLDGPDARAGLCPICSNSATVGDGIVFDELNVHGTRRLGGPRIVKVTMADGKPAKLRVNRHFLTAIVGDKTYANKELVGMVMELDMPDGRAYEVKLMEAKGCVADQRAKPEKPSKAEQTSKAEQKPKDGRSPDCVSNPFWVAPREEVPHFLFKVRKLRQRPGMTGGSACNAAQVPPARSAQSKTAQSKYDKAPLQVDDCAPEREFERVICEAKFQESDLWERESWKAVEHEAIAFEGDHYDAEHKRVRETAPEAGWFNLACAGTAVAKMHMLRHTRAGSVVPSGGPARNTSVLQRTAMLKAITADYCGDGTAWTADGTPLQWTDANGWLPTPALDLVSLERLGLIEGVWGPDGAMCLNDPRRQTKVPGLVYPAGGCSAPAVRRAEVVNSCRSMGNVYSRSLTVKAFTTPVIPFCDEDWIKEWKKVKGPYRPHVVTVNMAANPAVYCDRP
jgi:hypothetical protein